MASARLLIRRVGGRIELRLRLLVDLLRQKYRPNHVPSSGELLVGAVELLLVLDGVEMPGVHDDLRGICW